MFGGGRGGEVEVEDEVVDEMELVELVEVVDEGIVTVSLGRTSLSVVFFLVRRCMCVWREGSEGGLLLVDLAATAAADGVSVTVNVDVGGLQKEVNYLAGAGREGTTTILERFHAYCLPRSKRERV